MSGSGIITGGDGTYVQPHYRSNADGNPSNNYSTYPNINPYTGETGSRHLPSYSQPSSDFFGIPSRDYCRQNRYTIGC